MKKCILVFIIAVGFVVIAGCSDGPIMKQNVAAIDCPTGSSNCTVIAFTDNGSEVLEFSVVRRPRILIDTDKPYIRWYIDMNGCFVLTEIHLRSIQELTMQGGQVTQIKLEH